MNIISISQPGLQRVKNLSQITAGMWQSRAPTSAGIPFQGSLLHTQCYKPSEVQHTLHDRAGSCWFLFKNQCYTCRTQGTPAILSLSACLYTGLSSPARSLTDTLLDWFWVRNKKQTGLGGARTTLPSNETEEKCVSRKNQEPQAAQCSSCSVDHQPWNWALLSLSLEGGIVAENWTQASLGRCACQQWSHRVQLSCSILPGPNDFKEARSLQDVL